MCVVHVCSMAVCGCGQVCVSVFVAPAIGERLLHHVFSTVAQLQVSILVVP